jgi:D-alanyl-D-alanine carboxypeptidase
MWKIFGVMTVSTLMAPPSVAAVAVSGSQAGSAASYAAPADASAVMTFNTGNYVTEERPTTRRPAPQACSNLQGL